MHLLRRLFRWLPNIIKLLNETTEIPAIRHLNREKYSNTNAYEAEKSLSPSAASDYPSNEPDFSVASLAPAYLILTTLLAFLPDVIVSSCLVQALSAFRLSAS